MEKNVAALPPAPDPLSPQLQPAAQPAVSEPKADPAKPAPSAPAANQGSSPVDTRLVIEMDQASGSFVYKTIDRRTGEVVRQLPRAEVLKMRDGGQYEAGAVIKTQV